jgi:hypothetical protein
MRYSFAQLGENILTRKFGGTTMGVADPYVSGYHFVWFDKLPTGLLKYVQETGNSKIGSIGDIQRVLAASCLGVTPPGGTLSKIEFTGLGGIKWAVPGNVDYGNEVSMKFLEFSGTPLLDIMHGWVKMIRDYRTGTSNLIDGDQEGDGYTKKTYAGLVYYWTTAPDAQTVEFFACYDGIFPTKDPQDTFSSDVETVGRVDLDIAFNVDYTWRENWVRSKCVQLASTFAAVKENVKAYGQKQSG